MSKTKKIFLTTLIVTLLVLGIFYVIDLIDKKTNEVAYAKIDEFLKTIKDITYISESKYCTQQMLYFEQYDYTPDKSTNVIKAKNSCKMMESKIQALEIPNDISEKQKRQLFNIRNDYYDLYEDYYNLINIQQKYKKSDPKNNQLEYPYSKDIMIKTYYLPLKISNVNVSYSLKDRMKNISANIYFLINRKAYENHVDRLLKK